MLDSGSDTVTLGLMASLLETGKEVLNLFHEVDLHIANAYLHFPF